MSQLWTALISSFVLLWSTSAAVAQEHPEHPKDKKAEHPEHPKEAKAAEVTLTVKELAVAVKEYIEVESEENDGYFSVKDDQQKKALKLELTKVHEERLASLGDNVYFVCADFQGTDGNTYDIDIFMEGNSKDNLEATETSVHKMNNQERYTWHEEKGVWNKKSIGKTKGTSEHPEHPEGKEKSKEHPEGK
jgi:hypothetical protein